MRIRRKLVRDGEDQPDSEVKPEGGKYIRESQHPSVAAGLDHRIVGIVRVHVDEEAGADGIFRDDRARRVGQCERYRGSLKLQASNPSSIENVFVVNVRIEA